LGPRKTEKKGQFFPFNEKTEKKGQFFQFNEKTGKESQLFWGPKTALLTKNLLKLTTYPYFSDH
jgi:hypothetical protein